MEILYIYYEIYSIINISLQEALQITAEDILHALDGLPEAKEHCSNLGAAALHAAIQNYLLKQISFDS